jgi:hypothetical protein
VILISRHPEPATEESLSILGWVVVVTRSNGNSHLTNADLMPLETAEYEAAQCRREARDKGLTRRFQVRPVYGEEQQR